MYLDFLILIQNGQNKIKSGYVFTLTKSYYTIGTIYFKNRKDTQAVIYNYNFRDILNTVYKN